MEDEKIVQLYWNREEQAIEETDKKYGNRLLKLAIRFLNEYEDAIECQNDTYMKAWMTIPPQKPGILSAYLMRLCRFTACDRLDWKTARKRNVKIIELTDELEQCIPDKRAQDMYEIMELGQVLNAFLRQQSEKNAMIFMRRYWFGDSVKKIAGRYEMTDAGVKMNLLRMRKKLKAYLEKEGVSL